MARPPTDTLGRGLEDRGFSEPPRAACPSNPWPRRVGVATPPRPKPAARAGSTRPGGSTNLPRNNVARAQPSRAINEARSAGGAHELPGTHDKRITTTSSPTNRGVPFVVRGASAIQWSASFEQYFSVDPRSLGRASFHPVAPAGRSVKGPSASTRGVIWTSRCGRSRWCSRRRRPSAAPSRPRQLDIGRSPPRKRPRSLPRAQGQHEEASVPASSRPGQKRQFAPGPPRRGLLTEGRAKHISPASIPILQEQAETSRQRTPEAPWWCGRGGADRWLGAAMARNKSGNPARSRP